MDNRWGLWPAHGCKPHLFYLCPGPSRATRSEPVPITDTMSTMKAILPLQLIHIDRKGYHLMLKVRLNGLHANALLDTGASRTILDRNRVHHYMQDPMLTPYNKFFSGLGAEKLETLFTRVERIDFGPVALSQEELVVIDLASINHSYALFDLPRIDMVLGCDLLLKMRAVIDCLSRQLIVNN